MSNRPSGVLTEADREFLESNGDYYEGENARQKRYQRRRGIRGRITQSLLDFQHIRTYLDDKLRGQIFDEPEKNGAESDTEFRAAIQSLLAWLYLGCREAGIDFEHLLETAVTRAEEDYQRENGGDIVDVEVDLDVEVTARYDGVEELGRALEEGTTLAARNIYKIPMVGDIPVDPEKVDTVPFVPEAAQMRPDREKEIVETILRAHLGIEADAEVVGVADLEGIDIEYGDSAAVSPEDYRGGLADSSDSE
jgi:hypothetical protein